MEQFGILPDQFLKYIKLRFGVTSVKRNLTAIETKSVFENRSLPRLLNFEMVANLHQEKMIVCQLLEFGDEQS